MEEDFEHEGNHSNNNPFPEENLVEIEGKRDRCFLPLSLMCTFDSGNNNQPALDYLQPVKVCETRSC